MFFGPNESLRDNHEKCCRNLLLSMSHLTIIRIWINSMMCLPKKPYQKKHLTIWYLKKNAHACEFVLMLCLCMYHNHNYVAISQLFGISFMIFCCQVFLSRVISDIVPSFSIRVLTTSIHVKAGLPLIFLWLSTQTKVPLFIGASSNVCCTCLYHSIDFPYS